MELLVNLLVGMRVGEAFVVAVGVLIDTGVGDEVGEGGIRVVKVGWIEIAKEGEGVMSALGAGAVVCAVIL